MLKQKNADRKNAGKRVDSSKPKRWGDFRFLAHNNIVIASATPRNDEPRQFLIILTF